MNFFKSNRTEDISPGGFLERWLAAVVFYTCIPLPTRSLEFRGIARFAPLVGLMIGVILTAVDSGLWALSLPPLTRSALVVALWLGITGGLHLDGAMDTADGLAVTDPQQRLAAMADSRAGAFGVMAAVVILGLKTVALGEMGDHRALALLMAAGWGRWGQVVAIVRYPYLRPQGKGALHQLEIRPQGDLLLGLGVLLGVGLVYWGLRPDYGLVAMGLCVGGVAIALLSGAWFNRQLGGHTGDTYGATVEWTEALLLCLATLMS